MRPPDQSSTDSELRMALEAFHRGDIGTAAARVEKVLATHPGRADAKMAKGMVCLARGDEGTALTWLLASLEVEARNPQALTWATLISLNTRQFPQAEALARQLIQLQPKNHYAHYLLANALRGSDRVQEALVEVDKALAL